MTSVAALPPLASPGIFPPAAAPRFLSIQVLRAVAALGVIYQHIQYDFQVKFGIAGFPPRLGVTDLGVDLFFVISGFIMVYTSERLFAQPGGWKIFITRRLIRIVPIYWATSLAALAYILLRQRASDWSPGRTSRAGSSRLSFSCPIRAPMVKSCRSMASAGR
jgi:peptidoglycan/LPS O-acetylase OafA/YrhL